MLFKILLFIFGIDVIWMIAVMYGIIEYVFGNRPNDLITQIVFHGYVVLLPLTILMIGVNLGYKIYYTKDQYVKIKEWDDDPRSSSKRK